ncbi:hypothetical protein MBLNU459_g6961t2 [Dothideomycetes sp. NU459]
MLGPKLTRRIAVGLPQTHACRNLVLRPAARLVTVSPSPKLTLVSRRTYATPGRPKKAVGEPTKTVKRAVKRAASDKTTESAAAAKQKEQAKKAQEKAKKVAAAAQKKAKEKAKAAKEKAAAAAKKAKASKILTPEQREKAKKARALADIMELKKLALSPPVARASNTWLTFNGARTRDALKGENGLDIRSELGSVVKQNSQAYKDLSPAELEHWNHITNERNAKKAVEFKAWLEAHTPEEIKNANIARKKLRIKLGDNAKNLHPIHDERLVKNPVSSYILFYMDRLATKDFTHVRARDAAKLVTEEWKALTDSEKQKYIDLAAKDQTRYAKEHLEVYGHPHDTAAATAASA